MAEAAGEPARASTLQQSLPYLGLAVGAWALAAPYVLLGPDLNASAKNEFADHVVPGVVMLGLSVALLVRQGRGITGGAFPLLAGFGVLLAGLWMTATHLPLVSDARRGAVSYGLAAWHTLPGVVVMVLGGVWAAVHWAGAEEPANR
ncbi:MAG: hypothetical protein ACT4PX_03225 [Actinomycetota bacterium]